MLTREDIEGLLNKGGNVIGSDGEKIGSIGQLYADDDTGEPTWVAVETGLFGASQSFVPVEGARIQGDDLVVPYTKDYVKDAPRVEADGHLEPEEEDRLYAHYERDGSRTYSQARAEAADTTRSEEPPNADTDQQATGGSGLRRYVAAEEVRKEGTEPGDAEDARH
jgi:sporulation protein YlmC with PRC-barrel domain